MTCADGRERARAGIAITARRRVPGLRLAGLRRDAARVLRVLDVRAELSIALVDDAEMRRLNAVYRRMDRPTDVLAFAMRDGEAAELHPDVLGDVVISVETAARQAARHGVALVEEVRLLLTHGVLHLLGYDHERSPAEARRMFRKQRAVLRQMDERPGMPRR